MSSTADLVNNSSPDLTKSTTNDKKKTFKEMNFKEKLSYTKDLITVEPIIACYVISSVLCAPALNQLELEKACRSNCDYNDTICDSIIKATGKFANETTKVQQIIADMHSWQGPLQSFTPLILVLFLGSYSDRHQLRKPFMLIPIIGEFFAVAGCILCVIFMKEWPLEVQGVAQTVIPSFLGGQTMIVMAIFSYIADVSTVEMRTLRVGIVQIVLNVCFPAVQSFSGILFKAIGYIPMLCMAGLIYLIGLLYGIFRIKEVRTNVEVEKKSLLKDIFNSKLVTDTFKILYQNKSGNNRMFIWFIMLVLFVSAGVSIGEASLIFLYTNLVFKWTVVELSYFITGNTLIHLAGTAIALPLFTQYLKISDFMIIFVSFFDKILCNLIIIIFAKSIEGFYAGIAISIITGVANIGIRSAATKCVNPEDLGKAQSLFGVMEALAPAIAIPAFNKLYEVTISTYPAAFFIIGLVLYALVSIVVLIMYMVEKKENGKITDAKSNNVELKDNGYENTEMTKF